MFQVIKKVVGNKIIFISSISFLSLIFSLFIHSVVASSTMPTADPPDGNVNPPIYNDTNLDDERFAYIDREFVTFTDKVVMQNMTNCNSIDTDAEGKLVCGTDETGSATIPANSIDSSQIIDESLTSNDLALNSVGTSEVIDNSLTANDLAAGSVGTSEIISSQVQRRVSNSCPHGINGINEAGGVSCGDGNSVYEGPGWVEGVPSGRYLVNISGRAGVYDGDEDDVKVEAASPCGTVTSILSGYPLSEQTTVTPSFIFNLSCSTCATTALRDMCGMMGFTLRGYTDFLLAACSPWTSFCWGDTSLFAIKIFAVRLN